MTSERSPRLSPSGVRLSCDPGCLSGASGVGCCPLEFFTILEEDFLVIDGAAPVPLPGMSILAVIDEDSDVLSIMGESVATSEDAESSATYILYIAIDGVLVMTTTRAIEVPAEGGNSGGASVTVKHKVSLAPGTYQIDLYVAALGGNVQIRPTAGPTVGEGASLDVSVQGTV